MTELTVIADLKCLGVKAADLAAEGRLRRRLAVLEGFSRALDYRQLADSLGIDLDVLRADARHGRMDPAGLFRAHCEALRPRYLAGLAAGQNVEEMAAALGIPAALAKRQLAELRIDPERERDRASEARAQAGKRGARPGSAPVVEEESETLRRLDAIEDGRGHLLDLLRAYPERARKIVRGKAARGFAPGAAAGARSPRSHAETRPPCP